MDSCLREILLPSLAPCPSFGGTCAGYMRWEPQMGHVPRGWVGATGFAREVKLVLVTQEPGNPVNNEQFDDTQPDSIFKKYQLLSMDWLQNNTIRRRGRIPPFQKNVMRIISLCWPNVSFDEQMRKTWLTPSVLCSAQTSGADIPRDIVHRCGTDYLKPQLALLESAFVIALGVQAQKRLIRLGIRPNAQAQHPSARPYTKPFASWVRAAHTFRHSEWYSS